MIARSSDVDRVPPTDLWERQRILASLENRLRVVRDRTTAVVLGYQTGFYLHGEAGIGKSYTVLQELRRLNAPYKVFNSSMTGRGLFDALKKYPSAVHVLEDMEQLVRDRAAQGVLRSALWGQRSEDGDSQERLVTWSANRSLETIDFAGGIIMISNRPLTDLPQLNAIKTRIAVLALHASEPELQAWMRSVAKQGYEANGRSMDAAECGQVCDFLINESLSLQRTLDMRLLTNAFADYLQWQEGDASCHWRDLVSTRLRERAPRLREAVAVGSRTERKTREQDIARALSKIPDRAERRRRWVELTQKSEPALYRRLQELNGAE